MATGALAAKPHEDFGGDHARPSTADLNQVVQVDDAAIFKAGANAMMGAGVKGLGELRQMNMLKKENRENIQGNFSNFRRMLVNLTADPREEADKLGVTFDGSKVEVLTNMIFHIFFLAIFCVAIFVRLDLEQPYRMQYAMKEVIMNLEVSPLSNVRFHDITNVDQIFDFAKNVMIPNIYVQNWYNGREYPGVYDETLSDDQKQSQGPYKPYFFGDSSMTMGAVRLRQVRVKGGPCTSPNSTSFLAIMGDCYPAYSKDDDDRGGFLTKGGDWYPYQNDTVLDDDGQWQSPKTLVVYDSGGYVDDLPVGVSEAVTRLDELKATNFIDAATRALFIDFSVYCPNNDQFMSVRTLFEFTPSGSVIPFMEIIPAALLTDVRALTQDASTTVDQVQVIFELFLYVIIIAYLTRASDRIAQYPSVWHYLANPWNTLDILNVLCFICVFAIRLFWMMLSYKLEYDLTLNCVDRNSDGQITAADNCLSVDETDDKNYFPVRLPIIYYSFGKTFFAFGTLLSFIKTFRYIGVSRRLAVFTETVSKAFADVSLLMIVFVIFMGGFGTGFHVAFGQGSRDYQDFPSSALSLLLLSLGDFDADELRGVNPGLGMLLFTFYAFMMVFILLTMMLKIVDNAFHEMRQEMYSKVNKKENLALQMRLAIKKVFYDIYWGMKVKSVISSAKVTEKLIESMNKTGKGFSELAKNKKNKELAYLDESVLDLVEADVKTRREEEERLKKEEEARKKAERKAKKKEKKLSRSERKKRRAERPQMDTNLPENRRMVRDAIKAGRLGTIKEDTIDPLEITDRLDMMSHRSDILVRSAERLLDQVMILAEEANKLNLDDDDDDETSLIANKKKTATAPYGKTGDMFGLRGVREPVVNEADGEAITDLEQADGEQYVLKVPKVNPLLEDIDEPKDSITMGDIGNMYRDLGYGEEVADAAVEAEEQRLDAKKEQEEKELKKALKKKG